MSRTHRRRFLAATSALLAVPVVIAQPLTKTPRIGYLSVRSGGESRDEAFRQGLRELGYVEGKNITVEYRYARDSQDRLRELAAELVLMNVDVIVSAGGLATDAAKAATKTIPIVMTTSIDPVGAGLAASLAHPGGNITGLSSVAPEVIGKQFELLKEIVPKLARVAVFGISTQPASARLVAAAESAARVFGVGVQKVNVLRPEDIEAGFRAASKARADAVLISTSGGVFLAHRKQILELAAVHRFPAMYTTRAFVLDGGLVAYSPSFEDLFRRAATYVDKILKGAKPGDLPIEQPTTFELVVNLKTANALGLTIPQSVLLRATEVIQ